MNNNEKKIVRTAGVSHAMAHYFEILFPAMTMYVVEGLKIPINEVIEAGFLLYFLYGFMALPWGFFSDHYGSVLSLGMGILMAGIGAIVSAFAQNKYSLWLSLGIIGIGIAAVHPAAMSLISKSVNQRGRALGVFGIWGNFGIVSAPLVGGIGGFCFGWRMLMVISGIFGLCIAAYTLFSNIKEASQENTPRIEEMPVKNSLLCFIILCGAMMLAGIIYRGNLLTLPIYFEERPTSFTQWLSGQSWLGINRIFSSGGNEKTLGATLLISLAVLIGMIGQKIGGMVADRSDLRWAYFSFFLLGLPSLFSMAFLSGWALVFATSIFMIFSLGMQPIENSLVARLTPVRWRSTAYGTKFILSFGIGSIAVWLVSICMGFWGTNSVYFLLSILQILLLLTVAVIIIVSRGMSLRQSSIVYSRTN